MNPQNYFVYITTNADRHTVLYIGVTNNLELRLSQRSLRAGSFFAKQYNATKLIYYEAYPDPQSAIAREKQLKKWSRVKKEMLIARANSEWRDLLSEMYATKSRHPERQSRDPEVVTLKIAPRDPSTIARDDENSERLLQPALPIAFHPFTFRHFPR